VRANPARAGTVGHAGSVLELSQLAAEDQTDPRVGQAVAVLGHDDLGYVLEWRVQIARVRPIDEHDHVGEASCDYPEVHLRMHASQGTQTQLDPVLGDHSQN
jgi:hypothetical protein